MSFLHPGFLWALLALAIPVLIHLFQLRRFRRIDFSNVRLLRAVTQQTRARKKVQHWLVLAARLLALAMVVFAFAQPYIPGPEGTQGAGQRAISIYLDDSYSMDGENTGGRLLDQARGMARDLVLSHAPTDRFQVLTGRFEGRQQMLLGREDALLEVTQVATGPYSRMLSQVIERQREALSRSEAKVRKAVLFTDLQRSMCDVERWTDDETTRTVIVPIPPKATDNLSLDSAWFSTPVRRGGQSEALHVRVRNHGEQDLVNVPLRLVIDGQQRALASFSISANSLLDTVVVFSGSGPGTYRGTVSLDDHPVVFDDALHISYSVADGISAMLLSKGAAPGDASLAAVLKGDSAIRTTTATLRSLDLGDLDTQDLVVVNGADESSTGLARALGGFSGNGGSVALFPSEGADPAKWAEVLRTWGLDGLGRRDTNAVRVDRIDLDQAFYREVFLTMPQNVDLPVVRERYAVRAPAGSDVLLRTQDGSPYLIRLRNGQGQVYVCTSPLSPSGGGLVRHALFVTTLLRMAELSRPLGPLYHVIGADARLDLPGLVLAQDQTPKLMGPDGGQWLPEVRRSSGSTTLVLHDEDLQPGHYEVVLGSDTVATFALNTSRLGSDLRTMAPEELQAALERQGLSTFSVLGTAVADVSLSLTTLERGTPLWRWFIIAALCFLLAEVLLLRYQR